MQKFFKSLGAKKGRHLEICRQVAGDLEAVLNATVRPVDASYSDVAPELSRRIGELDALVEELGLEGQGPPGPRWREDAEQVVAAVAASRLMVVLAQALPRLEFETRKQVGTMMGHVCVVELEAGGDGARLLEGGNREDVLRVLIDGYAQPPVALICGQIARSLARFPIVVDTFLRSDLLLVLFEHTACPSFDVALDAFLTLHTFLFQHKAVAAAILLDRFAEFFGRFHALLGNESYVTKRQALKLLSETLLDRSFQKVMIAYVNNDTFLKLHMNLLRDNSKAIQFEAFHVFKIFAANPNKAPKVQQILFHNKDKLIKFFDNFLAERADDEQFVADKAAVVSRLAALEAQKSDGQAGAGPRPVVAS
mmetsp:Transcript_44110/g.95945  ORF Transcript_44110/g.95945 Transcript_44110/m.95945 type:complete len:366 (+) Transcript_44110:116-1213(+)